MRRRIHHLPWAKYAVHDVAQLSIYLAGFSQHLEILSVGAHQILWGAVIELWNQLVLDVFLDFLGWGFLFTGSLE